MHTRRVNLDFNSEISLKRMRLERMRLCDVTCCRDQVDEIYGSNLKNFVS